MGSEVSLAVTQGQPIFVRPDTSLVVLLVLYVGIASAYVVTIPLWEAPDEVAHFLYVEHVQERWETPRYLAHPHPRSMTIDEARKHQPESKQPPLFYWLNAALLRSVYGLGDRFRWSEFPRALATGNPRARVFERRDGLDLHDTGPLAIRFASVAIGGIAVYLTYVLGFLLFRDRNLALAAAAFHAFVPEFGFLVSAINNDTLAILFSSLAVVAMAAWLRTGDVLPRGPVVLATCATLLALLSKLTAVTLVPLLLWVLAKNSRMRRPALAMVAFGALGIAAYGVLYRVSLHHLGWYFLEDLYVWLFYAPYAEPELLSRKLGYFFSTRWGAISAARAIPLNGLSAITLDAIAICGAVGFALLYRRRQGRGSALALIPTALAVAAIVALRAQLSDAWGVQPRFFYPVLSAFSVMVAAGIAYLLPSGRKHWIVWLCVPLYAVSLLSLLLDVRPHFGGG